MDIWEYSKAKTGRVASIVVWSLIRQHRIHPIEPFYAQEFTDMLEVPSGLVHKEFRILRALGGIAQLGPEYEVEREPTNGPEPDWHVRINAEFWRAEAPALNYALKHYAEDWEKLAVIL